MAGAEEHSRSRNHIRQISHFYLSGSTAEAEDERRPLRRSAPRICVGGSEGSQWKLPFALNLALAAAAAGDSVQITLPQHLLAAGCRLLGASGAQLGPALALPELRRAPPLYPRLGIDTPACRAVGGDCAWRFELDPADGDAAAWLYLLDAAASSGFADPRAARRCPLFLVGLGAAPRPLREANGVWGSLAAWQLLHSGGAPRAAFLHSPGALRARYGGYLEALRRIAGPRKQLAAAAGGRA